MLQNVVIINLVVEYT